MARLGLLSDFKGELSAWKKQKYSESDKSFDANLSEVLKAFQQSRGIVPTGEIDDLTLRELRQASYTLGSRVLSYEPANELVGDDISQLQQQLQELGFYQQRVDGHFGTNTHAALKEYQHNCGLQEDGVCGPATIRALGLLGRRITGGSAHNIQERERVRNAGPKLAGKRVVIDPALSGASGKLYAERWLPILKSTPTPEESMAINRFKSGVIIIAGSGMCTGGRILHHFKHNLWREECHLVIPGFQARGTLGRAIVDGAGSVKLLHQRIASLASDTMAPVLTTRQRQVLELTGMGLPCPAIAERLRITEATVEKHLRLARAALGARNTAHAVLLAHGSHQIFVDIGEACERRGERAAHAAMHDLQPWSYCHFDDGFAAADRVNAQ